MRTTETQPMICYIPAPVNTTFAGSVNWTGTAIIQAASLPLELCMCSDTYMRLNRGLPLTRCLDHGNINRSGFMKCSGPEDQRLTGAVTKRKSEKSKQPKGNVKCSKN